MAGDITLLTGVPGVGKSTALSRVTTKRPILNFGTAMVLAAKADGREIDRDSLRNLPADERGQLRNRAFQAIPAGGILDIHLSIPTASGLEASIPDTLLASGRIRDIIILEAEPEIVAQRRSGRLDRDSPGDDPATIQTHQEHNALLAAKWAELSGCKVYVMHVDDYPSIQAAVDS